MAEESKGKRAPNLAFKRGTKGLEQYGGRIGEEWLNRLKGERGMRIFREMADNDDAIGSILFAIEMLMRNVEWRVEKFSDDPLHEDQAEFVETLMHDMESTWEDVIAEALSMLTYGYAPMEICYKLRGGPLQKKKHMRSMHSDGLVGWRDLAIRAQTTVDEWVFDEDGDVAGLWQCPPYGDSEINTRSFIPISKMLIFKTTSRRGNPEGRSVLRNAFVSWFHKKRIAEAEAIGAERDLAGLPVFFLPPEYFDSNDAEKVAILAEYRDIVENLRKDEQSGLLLPAIFDDDSNPLVKFELASSGSSRVVDTDKVIKRYDVAIARTVIADFIMLGHQGTGSYALSDDKTQLFSNAIGAWLKSIAAPINRHALRELYVLNGWDPSEMASIVPGDIEKQDVERFTAAVERLTSVGYLTPGREEDENHFRTTLNMPEIPEGEQRPAPADPDTGEEDL